MCGAIDGTHISAWVPAKKHNAFKRKKSIVCQNVTCACDFDMMFTFVYTGWELLLDQKMNFLPPWMVRFLLFTPLTHIISNIYVLFTPTNTYPEFVYLFAWQFYLVDYGFPYTNGYLPPYRRERFHLQDFWAGGDPRGFKELFNHRHSSLQMVIESCFGVLKNWFHVLRGMLRYKVCRQPFIVNTCCTLHNFICLADRTDAFFVYTPPVELGNGSGYSNHYNSDKDALAMANTRDMIVQLMWDSIHPPN